MNSGRSDVVCWHYALFQLGRGPRSPPRRVPNGSFGDDHVLGCLPPARPPPPLVGPAPQAIGTDWSGTAEFIADMVADGRDSSWRRAVPSPPAVRRGVSDRWTVVASTSVSLPMRGNRGRPVADDAVAEVEVGEHESSASGEKRVLREFGRGVGHTVAEG